MDYDERIEVLEEVLNLLTDMKIEAVMVANGYKPTTYKTDYLEKLHQDVGFLLIQTKLDKKELEDADDT